MTSSKEKNDACCNYPMDKTEEVFSTILKLLEVGTVSAAPILIFPTC